jgi:BON domain
MNSLPRTRRLAAGAVAGALVLTAVSTQLTKTQHSRLPDWVGELGHRVRGLIGRRQGSLLRDLRHEDTDDVVLADRVRSELGPLLKELDTPHIHVMAEGSRVLLHGEVVDGTARTKIEEAVRKVDGVSTIETHLTVGLLVGEGRPSQGHQDIPSSSNQASQDTKPSKRGSNSEP